MTYNIVWFKRDLRVHDHAPLLQANRTAAVLCLYIVEPSMWTAADAATQYYQFLRESLLDLDSALRKRGGGSRKLPTRRSKPKVVVGDWIQTQLEM